MFEDWRSESNIKALVHHLPPTRAGTRDNILVCDSFCHDACNERKYSFCHSSRHKKENFSCNSRPSTEGALTPWLGTNNGFPFSAARCGMILSIVGRKCVIRVATVAVLSLHRFPYLRGSLRSASNIRELSDTTTERGGAGGDPDSQT